MAKRIATNAPEGETHPYEKSSTPDSWMIAIELPDGVQIGEVSMF
jgi:hypothetical protein